MSETIIKVDHVRKTYRTYKSNFQKLKHMLILSSAGEKNRILKDVSFEIHKGERVAILSYPGGGKSTLLHIMAGIIKPEAGTVEVKEEPSLLFDYRLGFDSALSGHDNYEIRARLLGWSREQIKEREKEIFQFAGLGKLKDTPVKGYPKGGAVRLGFTISTVDKPDFLLMDEKLTFGSRKMNERCFSRLAELIEDPEVTLVMAANDYKNTGRFCNRGIVIHEGKVAFDGTYEEALQFQKSHSVHKPGKSAVETIEVETPDYDDEPDEMQ